MPAWKIVPRTPAIARSRRVAPPALLAVVILAGAASAPPANAQLNVLAPTFTSLNGGAVWGSVGFSTGGSGTRDERPLLRGGFAAFYGPFGGRGDTVVTFTETVSDSADTMDPDGSGSRQVHRRIHTTRQRHGSVRQQGDGKVTLLVGYQHSAFYRFGTRLFPETVPVGGVFVATLLGPYPMPWARSRLAWYAGGGGTIVRLSDLATRADTVAAELTTERSFAPEALLMLMYKIAPSYRVFLGASYQYIRLGSLTYRAVQSGERIPAAILATLPEALELHSVHVSLGFSFTASGLIPGR